MKNNSKTDRRRLLKISMRVVLALVVVGLLVVPVAVQADLKATNVASAWDFAASKFENGNVIIPWGEGTWVPFLHELYFDTDMWADPEVCQYDPASPDTTGTRWAGNMYYGLYHVDDAPEDAPGFQETQTWSLISCNRDGLNGFDGDDLSYPLVPTLDSPPAPIYERGVVYADCVPGGDYCDVIEEDKYETCLLGHCKAEIVTTLLVNLDQDCDNEVDDLFPVIEKGNDPTAWQPEMLCFYAEARTPTAADHVGPGGVILPVWSGPLQARISTVGGEKTVNFAVEPTAVDLAAFEAAPQGNGVLLTWETATEIDNLGFNIYRADSQVGQLVQINQHLIASQNPGSTVGAAYSFLDESAAPGATYYYWLEDIDASGMATKHGPVAAKTAAAKALPGRPRPAPMPGNAF